MEQIIDGKVLAYIPTALRDLVAACDRYDRYPRGYGYNVIFKDGETSIFADSVAGLKWACRQVENGRTGVIYG